MQISVRKDGVLLNESRFKKGPIYIGRQIGSQVFLLDRAVSRQHAVIYTDKNGAWVIEDLDSANKTFINRKAIHKCELKNDDNIRIADFSIKYNCTNKMNLLKIYTPMIPLLL